MIYTVTFNPAVDYVMRVNDYTVGKTNRAQAEEIRFGGKGINVSLILRELGAESVALGFIAGFTGDALRQYLEDRGVHSELIRLERGMTRINVKLITECETEINGGGPDIPPQALEMLTEKLDTLREGDTLVLSGSVPRSLPFDMYEQIMRRLAGREIRIAVDAERELLRRILPYRPFLIKPNRAELSDIVGRVLTNTEEIEAAARDLQAQGARNVLVSLGRDGAMLVDEQGEVHHSPTAGADIPPVSTVGAGDSMVAGFLCGVARGYGHALRLGIAAGSATACSAGLGTRDQIESFLRELTEKSKQECVR